MNSHLMRLAKLERVKGNPSPMLDEMISTSRRILSEVQEMTESHRTEAGSAELDSNAIGGYRKRSLVECVKENRNLYIAMICYLFYNARTCDELKGLNRDVEDDLMRVGLASRLMRFSVNFPFYFYGYSKGLAFMFEAWHYTFTTDLEEMKNVSKRDSGIGEMINEVEEKYWEKSPFKKSDAQKLRNLRHISFIAHGGTVISFINQVLDRDKVVGEDWGTKISNDLFEFQKFLMNKIYTLLHGESKWCRG